MVVAGQVAAGATTSEITTAAGHGVQHSGLVVGEPAEEVATTSKLAPRPEPYPEDVTALLARYPRRNGEVLQLFRTIAWSPRALEKVSAAGMLDGNSPIDMHTREIVILRVTARYGCEYEWGVHVTAFAQFAGLSEAQVVASAIGSPSDPAWSETEGLLVGAIDSLVASGTLDAESRAFFDATYDARQQLEILSLVGFYHAISNIAQVAGLTPEPGAARFPVIAEGTAVGAADPR
jgi:alkylhydroperoxidase family enzyme